MNWLKILPQALLGITWLILFATGYYMGSDATNQRNELKQSQITNDYQNKINELVELVRSQEIANQHKINTIISEQLEKEEMIKNDYENTIEDLRNNTLVVDGLHECKNSSNTKADMPRNEPATAELVCFTRADLYGKIEKSLAITAECDKVVEKYNALLKVYNQQFESMSKHTIGVKNE